MSHLTKFTGTLSVILIIIILLIIFLPDPPLFLFWTGVVTALILGVTYTSQQDPSKQTFTEPHQSIESLSAPHITTLQALINKDVVVLYTRVADNIIIHEASTISGWKVDEDTEETLRLMLLRWHKDADEQTPSLWPDLIVTQN